MLSLRQSRAEYIKEAVEAGAADFGENKPQELAAKYEQVSGVRWHQIGHLQKNKVRHIIGKTALIHSLDSIELAKEIDKRAKAVGIVQDVLIQVNISGEESKFGIKPENLPEMLESLKEFSNVNTTGLMTISLKAILRMKTESCSQNSKSWAANMVLESFQWV